MGNFANHFKDSNDFKIRVIDRLNSLKPIIDKGGAIDSNLLERYNSLKTEAVKVYSMKFDMENLRNKADVAGVDLEDLTRQMFGGMKNE